MDRPRGLYAILDVDTLESCALPLLAVADQVLSARPAFLQLRAKHAAPRQTLVWLRELVPLCRCAGVRLFANDRPDLAVLAGCDGVHVGQSDLPVREVRRFAPRLLVGVSTHNEEQLRLALGDGPDYVAYGPVFATRSKENPDPAVGMDGLERAAALCATAGVPLVGIGGLDLEHAAGLARLGVVGAVIAELVRGVHGLEEVGQRSLALHRALGGAEPRP